MEVQQLRDEYKMLNRTNKNQLMETSGTARSVEKTMDKIAKTGKPEYIGETVKLDTKSRKGRLLKCQSWNMGLTSRSKRCAKDKSKYRVVWSAYWC